MGVGVAKPGCPRFLYCHESGIIEFMVNLAEPLIVICGPTGVGKTRLAVSLGSWLPVEVISADSRQVYRGMEIGTGKPTAEERRAVRHHLLDVADPDEQYHAARFVREAEKAIEGIKRRGAVPLVVGGTGLYIRALLRGLAPAPPADPALRRKLREELGHDGSPALHARLVAVDPAAAKRIHPRDGVRIVRALEIHTLTGRPQGVPDHWRNPERSRHALIIGLTMERKRLYASLERRVDRMIADGFSQEVARLLESGYSEDLPSMRGIGYHHLAGALRGRFPMEEAVRVMKRDTKRYAKRQWTWFERETGIEWLPVDSPEDFDLAIEIAREMISPHLGSPRTLAIAK